MIAYVFWHWKKPGVTALDYETRQQEFHAALNASPPSGFLGSFSFGLSGAPWTAAGGDAYEDWYLLEDFGALGALNEGAVSGPRAGPHDAAAAVAEGGAAGIYSLRHGTALPRPKTALWLSKPAGMAYGKLLGLLAQVVEKDGAVIWMRQMTLGPAREFCLQCLKHVSLPSPFEALSISLRPVWPRSQSGTG